MKRPKLAAALIALVLLGALAADYFTGSVGVLSSAGMIGSPDRTGFKGSDEELQVVTAPARSGGVTTEMSGDPEGAQSKVNSSPDN